MRQQLVRCAYAAFLVLTFASPTRAQSFQGGLRGAVRDEDARVVPGITVTLTNEATNISRETVSNESGEYAFPAVIPGTYTVKAVLAGFKTFERKGLGISTQQFVALDLTMQVGSIEEAITVTGAAPILETSNGSVGSVLDNKTIEALPALNRNAYMSAVITIPTVQAQGNPYFSRMEDQSNGSLVSLGGGPLKANQYLLDGVSINDLTGRTEVFPSPEAIEELKVQVHTYDGEMGRSGGGVFNTTGRSGANAFHGSGFGQVRPNWSLNEPFFSARAGQPKIETPYYNYAGGSFGGPIKQNKTFFFAAYEGYRDAQALSSPLYLPTPLELQGNFSQTFNKNGQLIPIYDPATTTLQANGTYTRSQFQNNIIPAYRLSPVALAIAKYLPTAPVSAADGVPNATSTVPVATWAQQFYTKIEHKLTDKDTLTGLYLFQPDNEGAANYWQGSSPFADPGAGTEVRRGNVLALNNLYVPNNTTVVALRFGWTYFIDNEVPYGFNLASLGFPASFVNGVTYQKFPYATVAGYTNPTGFFGNRAYQKNLYTSWAANGSVSKLLGRQTIKYGADYRQIGVDENGTDYSSGNFAFASSPTQQNPLVANSSQGSGLATFMLGMGTGTTPVTTPLDFFVRYVGAYVQDDFRVNSRFTLNGGLRYEYETGMREVNNRLTVNFDPNAVNPLSALTGMNLLGGLAYAGQNGEPNDQGSPNTLKLSPRAGFAWEMNPSTVVRGGYGLYWSPIIYSTPGSVNYGQTGYTATNQIFQNSPVLPTDTLDNPYPSGLQQPTGNSLGLLTAAGGTVDYVDKNNKSPYVQQYSIEVQHQLGNDMSVSVTYAGTRGDNLSYGGSSLAYININTLTPAQLALGAALNNQVKNPFYGIAAAGAFSLSPTIAYGQLLRPFPEFGNVLSINPSGAISRYNAVILELNKRFSRGFGGRFSYTWSRLNDDQFGLGSYYNPSNQTMPLNGSNPAAEYSRSLLDIPVRIVAAPYWELPFGNGRKWATSGLGGALAGGWMVSAIATYDAGSPINITQADNTGSFGGVQRPNVVPGLGPNTPGSTLDRLTGYINPAAYSSAPAFTFGNAPRTDPNLRTPGRENLDLVFAKTVPLAGKTRGQFRIELLNATNTPKFVGPAAVFGASTFGTITTQAGFSRLTQFMFRVDW
jgi:trimeric autotransporter adhesin